MQSSDIHIEVIGNEREPVVVIDNFAPDPDRLRTAAKALNFAPIGEFYPGLRASAGPDYFAGLQAVLIPLIKGVFGYHKGARLIRAYYSLVTKPPAALSLIQSLPHFDDLEKGKLAILHYLTRKDLGGTSFYRHLSTGYETIDAGRYPTYLTRLQADMDTHGRPNPGFIGKSTPIFERIASFEPRYNRALLYRSSLLHCATAPNDRTLSAEVEDGRLTVASFLQAE